MTRRFYPRYSTSKQGLEDLYEVVDADGFVVSAEPMPWEQANKEARTLSAVRVETIDTWLSALSMPKLPGVSGVSLVQHLRPTMRDMLRD